MKEYYESNALCVKCKYTVFDSIPTTFIVESNGEMTEGYSNLLERYKEISQGIFYRESMPQKHCERNMWIVKPANLNQGLIYD